MRQWYSAGWSAAALKKHPPIPELQLLLDFQEDREGMRAVSAAPTRHDQPPIRRRKMTSVNDEPATPSAEASTAAQTLDAGPIQPSDDVRAELVALLEADESRLGEVYRALQRGLTPREIAAELEIATPNFVCRLPSDGADAGREDNTSEPSRSDGCL
jgi:hypothetical protein